MKAEQAIKDLIDEYSEDTVGEMNRCPKCGNTKVRIDYPEITCMVCGHSESLIDYPVSYREHRAYSKAFGKLEPLPVPVAQSTDADKIDKLQSQVNMLMGQAVYQQQKKTGLQRIDV